MRFLMMRKTLMHIVLICHVCPRISSGPLKMFTFKLYW